MNCDLASFSCRLCLCLCVSFKFSKQSLDFAFMSLVLRTAPRALLQPSLDCHPWPSSGRNQPNSSMVGGYSKALLSAPPHPHLQHSRHRGCIQSATLCNPSSPLRAHGLGTWCLLPHVDHIPPLPADLCPSVTLLSHLEVPTHKYFRSIHVSDTVSSECFTSSGPYHLFILFFC